MAKKTNSDQLDQSTLKKTEETSGSPQTKREGSNQSGSYKIKEDNQKQSSIDSTRRSLHNYEDALLVNDSIEVVDR